MQCRYEEQAEREISLLLQHIDGEKCWFCQQPLGESRYTNRHHLIAARYFRRHQIPWDLVVCAPAHRFCHALWHYVYDRGDYDWDTYRATMAHYRYGHAIFANSRWLLKGYRPRVLSRYWTPLHPKWAARPAARFSYLQKYLVSTVGHNLTTPLYQYMLG